MNKLVDGIITEDSDVFLFGARKVYRNVIESNKFVKYYDSKMIENELGLNRNCLILMALFLGSDYTLGVKGVGIVNAIEIVTAFKDVDALKRFKVIFLFFKQKINLLITGMGDICRYSFVRCWIVL